MKQKIKFDKRQSFLFQTDKIFEFPDIEWELPNLTAAKKISLDTEGRLDIWRGGKPCGLSVSTEDFSQAWYIPFAHNKGFNFPLNKVQDWAKDNLRDKDINLANAKHDFNTLRSVGIDLEANGNKLHDVMHCPALLYSNRQDYDLNSLLLQELKRKKAEVWGGNDYDKLPMADRPSEAIWAYACQDAIDTSELALHYAPRIDATGQRRVLDLEDALIFCVASMEREGALIDVEKLETWKRQAHNKYIKLILDLYKMVGARIEPTKPAHLGKLFKILHLDYPKTRTGIPSFTNEFLLQFIDIEPVRIAYEARQIKSLETKFLIKYSNAIGPDGKIHYALNQLKATTDDQDKKNVGAVTGRFSSSGGGKHIGGINVQQVINDEKQEKIPCISDFPIRDLFIASEGNRWLSADAKQIEYRLFAHYVSVKLKNNRLVKIYEKNPLQDYHDYVQINILKRPEMRRTIVKNCNFSKIYGIGIKKLANIYLKCSYEEAKEISDFYDAEFPEARQLLKQTIDLVKSRDTGSPDNRGWVKTFLGRKRQFTNDDLYYSEITEKQEIPYYAALNAVIQGTAADIMKIKLLELYNTRHETGFNMRFTVHDEVDGDIPDIECARKVEAILNAQAIPLKVPILWEVEMGRSWYDLEKLAA
jgi:DNA polymerase I-like protein with 3'-5' exonuclease and polymerase domains